jgi:hypothetical protein
MDGGSGPVDDDRVDLGAADVEADPHGHSVDPAADGPAGAPPTAP